MTKQMSLKHGLQLFRNQGADAMVSEMQQLDYWNVILPHQAQELTKAQKWQALRYLMYLKQK